MKLSKREKIKMKNTNINNTNKTDDIKYILMLCKEQKDLILKTEFGIGRYQFTKFNELHGNTVLEFELLEDNRYKDTSSINKNIGSINTVRKISI